MPESAPSAPGGGSQHVSFCHRTDSVKNPYNLVTTEADSIMKQGHGSHTGPVFLADDWGDIIPPFDYTGGSYPGLNWPTSGIEMLAEWGRSRRAAR